MTVERKLVHSFPQKQHFDPFLSKKDWLFCSQKSDTHGQNHLSEGVILSVVRMDVLVSVWGLADIEIHNILQ